MQAAQTEPTSVEAAAEVEWWIADNGGYVRLFSPMRWSYAVERVAMWLEEQGMPPRAAGEQARRVMGEVRQGG